MGEEGEGRGEKEGEGRGGGERRRGRGGEGMGKGRGREASLAVGPEGPALSCQLKETQSLPLLLPLRPSCPSGRFALPCLSPSVP